MTIHYPSCLKNLETKELLYLQLQANNLHLMFTEGFLKTLTYKNK